MTQLPINSYDANAILNWMETVKLRDPTQFPNMGQSFNNLVQEAANHFKLFPKDNIHIFLSLRAPKEDKFESADLRPTPTYTVEQVHRLLERQSFDNYYRGAFEDYINGGDGTKNRDELRAASLDKLEKLLKDFGGQ